MKASLALRFLWLVFSIHTCYSKHVRFSLHLTWETGSPDGDSRQMVKINGGSPGPQLNLDYGDTVEVNTNYA